MACRAYSVEHLSQISPPPNRSTTTVFEDQTIKDPERTSLHKKQYALSKSGCSYGIGANCKTEASANVASATKEQLFSTQQGAMGTIQRNAVMLKQRNTQTISIVMPQNQNSCNLNLQSPLPDNVTIYKKRVYITPVRPVQ